MDRTQVPLLRTPLEVADWLDNSHPYNENAAVFDRIDDHIGTPKAMRLWADGAALAHPAPVVREPQGATCPDCGRYVPLLIDGQLSAHTIPGLYDRGCHHEGGA